MQSRWFGTHHRFLTDPSSDTALLGRYHENRDPAAFECLVWRHSGLVLGTCERMLRDQHLAEDAYQATFLILARKAGTVHGVLPAWLHKVARRVCLRLRKKMPLPLESDIPARAIQHTLETDETTAILDTEIARLPEKLRRVIVLCYLQNLTAEAAARQLGIPRGTVLSRLDTARRKLQATLTRRGVAPLALLALPLIHSAPAVALVQATTRAVLEFSSGAVTTPITELATEVLHMTTRKWIAGTALAIMLIAGTTTGVGLFTANGPGTSQVVAQAPAVPPKPVVPKPAEDVQKVEILKQIQQLVKTEDELSQRISHMNKIIIEEQKIRDAEISARALKKAIDKIDDELLGMEIGNLDTPELVQLQKNLVKRRAELVERHRKASGISDNEKLLEDELQVLREFHKTVMKHKLTLKLELDGVKLPGEPPK